MITIVLIVFAFYAGYNLGMTAGADKLMKK